jgi:hypothetical protein
MKGALEDVTYGDPTGALATLEALEDGVNRWLETHRDPDIEKDLVYLERLRELVRPLADDQFIDQPPPLWPID